MEEALADIGMKSINVVVFIECYGEESWLKSLGEVYPEK